MKSLKKIEFVVIVIAMLLGFASCGNSATTSGGTTTGDTGSSGTDGEQTTDDSGGTEGTDVGTTDTDVGAGGTESGRNKTGTSPAKLLADKVINDVTYGKTEELDVITVQTTIHITDDSSWSEYVDSGADDKYKGVFIKDRKVTLSPFAIGKYEVTQELYKAVLETDTDCNAMPSILESNPASGETQERRPVEGVTWYDAVYFCNALTKLTMSEADCVYTITDISRDDTDKYIEFAKVTQDLTKKGYRLPTEAEWEFAARGGDSNKPEWKYSYAGVHTEKVPSKFTEEPYADEALNACAWYDNTMSPITHEVGKKKPNSLGLYDMSGNVKEWVWGDKTHVDTVAVTDPVEPDDTYHRLCRGCGFRTIACYCAVSTRIYEFYGVEPGYDNGFRLARSL